MGESNWHFIEVTPDSNIRVNQLTSSIQFYFLEFSNVTQIENGNALNKLHFVEIDAKVNLSCNSWK